MKNGSAISWGRHCVRYIYMLSSSLVCVHVNEESMEEMIVLEDCNTLEGGRMLPFDQKVT